MVNASSTRVWQKDRKAVKIQVADYGNRESEMAKK